jgi:hypothetical protein
MPTPEKVGDVALRELARVLGPRLTQAELQGYGFACATCADAGFVFYRENGRWRRASCNHCRNERGPPKGRRIYTYLERWKWSPAEDAGDRVDEAFGKIFG